MSFYFNLQYKMLNRHLREFGIIPFWGYLLGAFLFIGLSVLLFIKTDYAAYIYVFFALSFLTNLSETNRTGFLKYCFSKKDYRKLRLIENIILVLPFSFFLLYQSNWEFSILLVLAACVLAFKNFNRQFNFALPTPFYKYPFEFTVGFRKTFLIPLFAYFLCIMAISVGNFNLGIFALLVIFLVCLTYYTEVETKYYVWIFSFSPKRFIWSKLKIALASSTLLALPITIGLGIFFPDKILIVLGFQALAYIYLLTIVLAKYAVFPGKINLAQVILFSFCIGFPPFLLAVAPFFYFKSIQKLKET